MRVTVLKDCRTRNLSLEKDKSYDLSEAVADDLIKCGFAKSEGNRKVKENAENSDSKRVSEA